MHWPPATNKSEAHFTAHFNTLRDGDLLVKECSSVVILVVGELVDLYCGYSVTYHILFKRRYTTF